MPEPKIAVFVENEAECTFRFTYATEDGEITGRVSVPDGTHSVDSRSLAEKRRAAEQRIGALCACLAQACDENDYAHRNERREAPRRR
jgi:hypothetical protein